MKLNRFRADHFLTHAHLDLQFTGMDIVCGPNGSGKSSLREGIAYVLTSEASRGIVTKADRQELVTDGAADGVVELSLGDGVIQRKILDGKSHQKVPLTTPERWVRAATPFVLDHHRFTRTEPDARRALLQAVMGADTGPETIKAELAKRDHPKNLLEYLKGTLPEMLKMAERGATEARGGWKALAGETYGSTKAETFMPTMPTQPLAAETDLLVAEERDLDEQIGLFDRELGAIDAQAASNEGRRAELTKAAARPLPDAKALHDASIAEVVRLTAIHKAESGKLAQLRAQASAKELSCPDCGSILDIQDGTLIHVNALIRPTATMIEATTVLVDTHQANLSAETKRKGQFQEEVQRAQRAAAELAKMPPSIDPKNAATGNRADVERQKNDAIQRRGTVRAKISSHRSAVQTAREATQKSAMLSNLHQTIKAWVAIAADLAPDGIPGQLLQKVLGPLNDTLREYAASTGWKQVSIGADMTARADGRAYARLSESEQWRTDAMLTVAIAVHSNLRFVLLDRFDILEPAARGPAMAWLYSLIKHDILDSVLVLGTFKAPPKVPPAISVHWLGEPAAMKAAA